MLTLALLVIGVRLLAGARYVYRFGPQRLLPDIGAVIIYGYLFWKLYQGRRWAWWVLLGIVAVTLIYTVLGLSNLAVRWTRGDVEGVLVFTSIPAVHLYMAWVLLRLKDITAKAAA